MAFVICILLVFMLHQKQYEFLIYRFTNLIGLALISLAVVSASIALDYAAVSIYRRARGSSSRTQCGQVLDYTAFFCVMASFAVSALDRRRLHERARLGLAGAVRAARLTVRAARLVAIRATPGY